MNVNRICSLGYFDNVVVDGYTMPLYNTKGINIKNNETFFDAINNNIKDYIHGVGKVRITIYGESTFDAKYDELLSMRFHREQTLKLTRTKVDNKDRYAIAYVDIILLKSESYYPNDKSKEQSIESISTVVKSEDSIILIEKALELQKEAISKNIRLMDCNVVIVDRVYVNKTFRQCGISSWIHENLYNLVKAYSMLNTYAMILLPGDFSNESEAVFKMSKKEYTNMLINHYKSKGYKSVGKHIMCKYSNVKL